MDAEQSQNHENTHIFTYWLAHTERVACDCRAEQFGGCFCFLWFSVVAAVSCFFFLLLPLSLSLTQIKKVQNLLHRRLSASAVSSV